jgi:hypothetical protein
MHFAIQGILQFQIFQIPFVGADTCGFSEWSPAEHGRVLYLGQMATLMKNSATVGCSYPLSHPSIVITTSRVPSLRSLTVGIALPMRQGQPLPLAILCCLTG